MLISPTEPVALKALGTASWVPEDYGVDVLWYNQKKKWGVQRKTPKDFIASVQDGRLNKEIQQMKSLDQAVLIVDGEWQWTTSGNWVGGFISFTRAQLVSLMCSIQMEGVWVFQAKNMSEVISIVEALQRWSGKTNHTALKGRREQMMSWGKPQNRDYQIHVLTSLPGVGVELAERILDTLGMIVTSTVSLEQLMSVQGIGKKKAQKILSVLTGFQLEDTGLVS